MAKAKTASPEAAQFGLLDFLSGNLKNFKASDYGAVQRAVKLAEIIERGLTEGAEKRMAVFTKHGIKPGETITPEDERFPAVKADLDEVANEYSSVSINETRIFTVEEFERDAIRDGGLDYSAAGILGKWLVKQ